MRKRGFWLRIGVKNGKAMREDPTCGFIGRQFCECSKAVQMWYFRSTLAGDGGLRPLAMSVTKGKRGMQGLFRKSG